MLAAAGARLRLIAVTGGEASHPGADPEAIARVRTAESAAARHVLGLQDIEVIRLRLPDAGLGGREDELASGLRELCAGFAVCLAPWEADAHADHEAAGRAARRAARPVLSYPIWMWHWAEPADRRVAWPRACRVPLPAAVAALKADATRLLAAAMLAAYGLLMTPAVKSMVSATYVRDIDTSRAFYELLGFREQFAGTAATSAWSSLHHGGLSVLLTSTTPPLDIPQLPLLFYFFYDDIDAVVRILDAAGVQVTHTGHPPHALGGEVKVLDPDGNTVLLGQREPSTSQPPNTGDEASVRFSLLREAAALVSARGGAGHQCQARDPHSGPCLSKADVKLADSMGDKAWVCLAHADEILLTVPEAFIASEDGRGLAAFLSRS